MIKAVPYETRRQDLDDLDIERIYLEVLLLRLALKRPTRTMRSGIHWKHDDLEKVENAKVIATIVDGEEAYKA